MYAIYHNSQDLISLSYDATRKVIEAKELHGKPDYKNGAYYRCLCKGEVCSFFSSYEEAKGFQALLFMHGGQS